MRVLSKRQKEVLSFIIVFREVKGYSPSSAEIAKRLGGNAPNARAIVLALEKKGYVSRRPNIPRSVVPFPNDPQEGDEYYREIMNLLQNGTITVDDKGGEISFSLSAAGERLVEWIEEGEK